LLDPIPPEQVMQCQSEEDCARVAKCLPLTEAALLDWAVNLMADVVQEEHINKMNARNIAMVFAPNMTQVTYHPFSRLAIHLMLKSSNQWKGEC
jgi:ubiquitin C-terminal hydrolase